MDLCHSIQHADINVTILLPIGNSFTIIIVALILSSHLFEQMEVLSYMVGRSVFRKRTLVLAAISQNVFRTHLQANDTCAFMQQIYFVLLNGQGVPSSKELLYFTKLYSNTTKQ